MEKLAELLNKYKLENRGVLHYGFELRNGILFCYDEETYVHWTMQDSAMVICDNKFGFIRRLFNKGKINYNKLEELRGNYYDHFNYEETLIQMLALEDYPFRLLIKVLN